MQIKFDKGLHGIETIQFAGRDVSSFMKEYDMKVVSERLRNNILKALKETKFNGKQLEVFKEYLKNSEKTKLMNEMLNNKTTWSFSISEASYKETEFISRTMEEVDAELEKILMEYERFAAKNREVSKDKAPDKPKDTGLSLLQRLKAVFKKAFGNFSRTTYIIGGLALLAISLMLGAPEFIQKISNIMNNSFQRITSSSKNKGSGIIIIINEAILKPLRDAIELMWNYKGFIMSASIGLFCILYGIMKKEQ